jgi:hypothetical protein
MAPLQAASSRPCVVMSAALPDDVLSCCGLVVVQTLASKRILSAPVIATPEVTDKVS